MIGLIRILDNLIEIRVWVDSRFGIFSDERFKIKENVIQIYKNPN